MLKYLAGLVLVFGLTVYVSVQDKRATEQAATNRTQGNEGSLGANADENHPQEDVPYTERSTPGWYRFFRWPDGPTTWVIVLTLLAIAEQAKETAKATRAVTDSLPHQKNAAEAALQNARAVINSERPWMIFELQPIPGVPKKGYVSFNAYNRGRTPARIISHQGQFFYRGRDNEDWEENPTFEPIEDYHKTIVTPGNSIHVYGFSLDGSQPPDNFDWMERNNKYLYFRGQIVYEDLISNERHESRFCYWLSPATGIGLIMGGGLHWNKYS